MIYEQLIFPIDTIEMCLSNGSIVLIDFEDYELVSKYKWHIQKSDCTFYVRRSYKIGYRNYTQCMHTLITGYSYVDHKNGNGLDNRKRNLRESNNTLNKINARKRKGNCSSKYKGVSWSAIAGKWKAQINKDHKSIHLGYFVSEEDAAIAYDKAALRLYGEFAKPNFVEEGMNNVQCPI